MSGGGSTPKPPDLTKNTDRADQTFDTATSNAAQVMNTAKTYNDQAQQTLGGVVGQQTTAMKQLNDSASQNLSQYGSTFMPLQQQQADSATNYASEDNINMARGRAVADTNAANDAALRNSRQRLMASGVDPNSIAGRALDQQARVQQAAQAAGAANNAAIQREEIGNQRVAAANQLGLQVNQAGQTGAANAANIGSQAVTNTNQTNATGINNLNAGNTYLQTGLQSNQQSSDITNQGFKNQMDVANLQAQKQASTMSAIGSVAGAAAMFMESGGMVPDNYGIPPQMSVEPRFITSGIAMHESGGRVTEHGALPVPPVPGSTDRKLTMLTPGEFVIPKDVVQWKGEEYFHKELDKIRQKKGEATGALPSLSSVHTSRGV